MTSHIDPSYLRTIHDGLQSGSLHPDNASALPDGLTGLYESALPADRPNYVIINCMILR